ncbi:hypothetical protein IX332_001867 [Porphyromonas levii]|uniref:aminopeptidase P family protein n=1 Tax=Porphyromonas levii TaxID=28114 RepID=UPI001B8B7216|nr:aminopeptidase P family protein [Porphyromonas levii]MBR8730518.1 hypothetical protein [Porphyromonas levii]
MKEEIKSRLQALRNAMSQEHIDAYIIPSSDHHLSEYTPDCWKDREWISGFNGSAGTAVVAMDEAGLWTDSRYFLQGAAQLEGTTFTLRKEGLADTPSISDYLRKKEGIKRVGFFEKSMSTLEALRYKKALEIAGIEIVSDKDLVSMARTDAPEIPRNPFFVMPLEYAGESSKDKVARVRTALADKGANAIIVNMLCELAWLFNIRSNDVAYNPVGIGYGLVTKDSVNIYAFAEKLPEEVQKHLKDNGVTIKPYEAVYADVASLPEDTVLSLDPQRNNYAFYRAIPSGITVIEQLSPITLLKAVKNKTEYKGYKDVMKRDGAALTRFFIWLEKALAAGETPTEYEVGIKLSSFRAMDKNYVNDSFGTIAGFRGHGAIVHYSATPESSYELEPNGMFLLDSGGQYYDGTTDITRTVSLGGQPTKEEMGDYTRVLKGHIQLAMAIYPAGTRGSQLDILARKALWDNGQNYGHGTGHGVGYFLNVHEGPQNIRMDENPTVLQVGMVTSNEPGIYIAGKYGIRIENLVCTVPYAENDFGKFLTFETLTLCYLDNNLVEVSLLTDKELAWYNDYQARVYKEVSPLLSAEEAAWLKDKTAPLSK